MFESAVIPDSRARMRGNAISIGAQIAGRCLAAAACVFVLPAWAVDVKSMHVTDSAEATREKLGLLMGGSDLNQKEAAHAVGA